MISLRLSPEEFDALHDLCRSMGSRSISDFARNAMQEILTGSKSSSAVEAKLQNLDARISLLDGEVAKMVRLIESQKSSAAPLAADA